MISRKQVLQMIEANGADIERWPILNKKAMSDYIENDERLSLAISTARDEELMLQHVFAASEPQWSTASESALSEKINRTVLGAQQTKKAMLRWLLSIQNLFTPLGIQQVFPSVVAMLILFVVIQTVYQQPLSESKTAYSTEELHAWLVLEGLDDVVNSMEADDRLTTESKPTELDDFTEIVYYL